MTFKLPENSIADFLNTVWLDLGIVQFDMWSIVHLITGSLLFYLKPDWRIVLGLLIVWEVVEILLRDVLFVYESIPNIILDIVLGMLGFFIVKIIMSM